MTSKEIKEKISLICFIDEDGIPVAGIWVSKQETNQNEEVSKEVLDLFNHFGITLAKRELAFTEVEILMRHGPNEWKDFLHRMHHGLITIQQTKRELEELKRKNLSKIPYRPDPRSFNRNKRNWNRHFRRASKKDEGDEN